MLAAVGEGGVLPAVVVAMLRPACRQALASGSETVEKALNLAMTGESIPFGQVRPVGGIRDKVLAAHRGGLTRVKPPHRNRPEVDEKARRRPPPRARSPLGDRHRRPAGPGATAGADVSGAVPLVAVAPRSPRP